MRHTRSSACERYCGHRSVHLRKLRGPLSRTNEKDRSNTSDLGAYNFGPSLSLPAGHTIGSLRVRSAQQRPCFLAAGTLFVLV